MLNSKVVDYINYILRASEFKNCDSEKVGRVMHVPLTVPSYETRWYDDEGLTCRNQLNLPHGTETLKLRFTLRFTLCGLTGVRSP